MKKVKGLRRIDWQFENSHRGAKYSTGNIVNNTVITVCGVRWVLEILGESLCNHYAVHLKLKQNNIKYNYN